jgi:ribosomal-protein-alanine N-acetyltransferase
MREFPLLETEHLLLRSLTLEDEADVFAIYSNPEVTRFRDVVTLANKSQARAVIQAFQAEFERDSGVRWAITERGTSRLIGLCGGGWYRHNLSALLSYDLNQHYWNRGIMTEAVRAVVAYTFGHAGTNRITATTVVENPASRQVLRHAGFQEEGILRDWGFWKGDFKDLRCFSLLRKDTSTASVTRDVPDSLANRRGGEGVGSCSRPCGVAATVARTARACYQLKMVAGTHK